MIEPGGGLRFAKKPHPPIWIGCHISRQDLKGHVPPEPAVACPIHLSHPTLTEKGNDVVGAELVANRKTHMLPIENFKEIEADQ
jgi:hypothetical protein